MSAEEKIIVSVVFDNSMLDPRVAASSKKIKEFAEGSLGAAKQALKGLKAEMDKTADPKVFADLQKQAHEYEQRIKSITNTIKEQEKVSQNLANLKRQSGELEFKETQRSVQERAKLERIQQRETEALQAYLGKMEQRGALEAEIDARKYTAIRKNIEAAEKLSQVQMKTGVGSFINPMNMDRGAKSAHALSMAMMNLNYVVRDSPYFFQSFAFGLLAIGNNLNPLIDSMRLAALESKRLGTSLGSQLLQFLKGPGGVTFGFSLLVTAIQGYVFATQNASRETGGLASALETAYGSLVKIKSEFEGIQFGLNLKQVGELIPEYEKEIKRLEAIQYGGTSTVSSNAPSSKGMVYPSLDFFKGLNEEDKKRKDANETILKHLKEQKVALEAQKLIYDSLKAKGIDPESKTKKEVKPLTDQLIESEEELLKKYDSINTALKINKDNEFNTTALLKEKMEVVDKLTNYYENLNKAITKYDTNLPSLGNRYDVDYKKYGNFDAEGNMKGVKIGFDAMDEQDRFNTINNSIKESFSLMKDLQGVANTTGNALVNAFAQGKFAIEDMIKSLIAAIAQMLIIRGIAALFTGGSSEAVGAVASVAGATQSVPGLDKTLSSSNFSGLQNQSKQIIEIRGNIRSNKQDFIVDLKKAEASVSRRIRTNNVVVN